MNEVPTIRIPKLWLFQGITIVTIIGAAWYLSSRLTAIEGRLDQEASQTKSLTEQTNTISDAILNPQQGMAVRIARIEEKVAQLQEWTKTISPKIVKSEFDQEINRLNARISDLQKQLRDMSQALQTARTDLVREREASERLRGQVEALQKDMRETTQNLEAAKAELSRRSRELESFETVRKQVQELDFGLSDAAHDLGSIEEATKSTETQLPEDYRSSLLDRLTKLQQKLEDLRKQIKRITA